MILTVIEQLNTLILNQMWIVDVHNPHLDVHSCGNLSWMTPNLRSFHYFLICTLGKSVSFVIVYIQLYIVLLKINGVFKWHALR